MTLEHNVAYNVSITAVNCNGESLPLLRNDVKYSKYIWKGSNMQGQRKQLNLVAQVGRTNFAPSRSMIMDLARSSRIILIVN